MATPILVGEVRWARVAVGCSCRLSGGSQLSSGPTCWSKNAQVCRARLCRNRRSPGAGAKPLGVDGLLSHQAMAGLASHSTSRGAAAARARGVIDSSAASGTASAGPIHIIRYRPPRRLVLVRSTSRDGFHCNSRDLLTYRRHRVRKMASRL
ncbi:hypothetical protein D9M70_292530 [compost metagenome]